MDLCNRNDIQALLQRHGFHFSKAMGQNFLIEGWVPRDIAAASGADEHTGVLEIGVPAGREGGVRGAGPAAVAGAGGDHGRVR